MIHTRKKIVVALAMMGAMGAVHADIIHSQSYEAPKGMRLGATTKTLTDADGTKMDKEVVGIGVGGAYVINKLVPIPEHSKKSSGVHDWSGREISSKDWINLNHAPLHQDALICANGSCKNLNNPWAQKHLVESAIKKDNEEFGSWTYMQAATDVWFGEWHADTQGGWFGLGSPKKLKGTRTVWYAGKNGDVASTLPKNAPIVDYRVKTIGQHKEPGWIKSWLTGPAKLPESTLTANFDTWTAHSEGDIHFREGAIKVVDKHVELHARNVEVASSGAKSSGILKGHFFGTGAASVAGMVIFGNRDRDVSFAGTKINSRTL